jgi:hypothetical protein
MTRACTGDRRALLAIAGAFGPRRVAQAREELPEEEHRAADAVVEFVSAIGDGALLYTRGKRSAVPWMVRMVRKRRVRKAGQQWASGVKDGLLAAGS